MRCRNTTEREDEYFNNAQDKAKDLINHIDDMENVAIRLDGELTRALGIIARLEVMISELEQQLEDQKSNLQTIVKSL